ncbi:MAG: hypothetical protein B6242_08550 [Anaerolineaceae bacterium 4572_78]|nr:MAG: hypothetical protein B6242_08550 [Anaerolineaceae bacterium 4572_78]
MKAKTKYRYRLTFRKGNKVKYVGHLSVITVWTRAFRRAGVPLAYSQGFNPQARLQFAASLPLGYIGSAELIDVFLKEAVDEADMLHHVNDTLPTGFKLHAIEMIAPNSPSTQNELRQANYNVTVETATSSAQIEDKIKDILLADKIMQIRTRRKKEETYNLRPLLHDLSLVHAKDQAKAKPFAPQDVTLHMQLSVGQHGNLRPESVLKALDLDMNWYEIERMKLIF